MDDPSIFEVLWFRDTPFGTLMQEDGWKVDKSLWSMMSPEAYQDAINSDLLLKCYGKFITPEYIINGIPYMYECSECHKRSFSQFECQTVKKIKKDFENPLFVDSSFIVYRKPETSKLSIEHGVCVLHQHQLKEEIQLPEPVPRLEETHLPEQEDHHLQH